MDYWEDRLAKAGKHAEAANALDKFRNKKRKTKTSVNILYDALTKLGVTSEEADEIINLELEQ